MYVMYVKVDGMWLSVLELQNGLHQINTDMKTRINMNPMIHRVQIRYFYLIIFFQMGPKVFLVNGSLQLFGGLFPGYPPTAGNILAELGTLIPPILPLKICQIFFQAIIRKAFKKISGVLFSKKTGP